jgi:hypothetical protein
MTEKPISLAIMKKAFTMLDERLDRPVTLIMGGGGAMIFAHGFNLATTDVDAIPKGIEIHELDQISRAIAIELNLPSDWLNGYFSTFSYVILPDFNQNLIRVFAGKQLAVDCLSREDMLIMKCFAHRPKDVSHAKALLKLGVDLPKIEKHIEAMKAKRIGEAQKALDFLDDLLEQLE